MTSHTVTNKQIERFINDMGDDADDIINDLCVQITKELADACKAVGDKYLELEKKFPELMSMMGFSAIATCNALPIDIKDPPVCVVVGTAEGIRHAAHPLIEAFGKIQQEINHDKG